MNKKWIIFILTGMLVSLNLSTAMGRSGPSTVIAEFPASSLTWIHIAESRFAEEKMDLSKSKIIVSEANDSVTVELAPLGKYKEGQRGCPKDALCYAVEISKNSRKIISAYHAR